MTPGFDMKKVTSPLLLHMLGKELRYPRLFLLRCKFTLAQFKKTLDKRFPPELIDLAALPVWVYLNPKKKVGQHRAFEIMRVALLTGGTATQNLQIDTVHKERNFQNFSALEIENNRTGLVRWNQMEVVERSARRFEIKITRCVFHEFAISVVLPELTPVVCQIDNAMFNSYLPDEMTFDRGLRGGRMADGRPECNFVWQLQTRSAPSIEAHNV